MKSIIQHDKRCFVCGNIEADTHHIRLGNCSRKKAEKYGLIMYLCWKHHRELHDNPAIKESVQKMAQKKLEQFISHDEYMKNFKKNYLERN